MRTIPTERPPLVGEVSAIIIMVMMINIFLYSLLNDAVSNRLNGVE
jgi:hypothetical protein